MKIVVNNPGTVLVDGENFGAVADAIANNPQYASNIQRALVNWHQSEEIRIKSEHETVIAKIREDHGNQIIKVNEEANAEQDTLKIKIKELESKITTLIVESQRPEKEKIAAELDKQMAVLQKQKELLLTS